MADQEKYTIKTLTARVDALQQDQSERNVTKFSDDILSAKQVKTLAKQVLGETDKSIAHAVEKYVNGGIREIRAEIKTHNEKHEQDMKRMMPIIEAFEQEKDYREVVQKKGRSVIFWTSIIAGIGGVYLIGRDIIYNMHFLGF